MFDLEKSLVRLSIFALVASNVIDRDRCGRFITCRRELLAHSSKRVWRCWGIYEIRQTRLRKIPYFLGHEGCWGTAKPGPD